MIFIAHVFAGPAAITAQEPPVAGQPPQFSGIVGTYAIHVTAAPTAVPVEEPITLRVTITGNGPPKYRPQRQHLKLFPDRWARDFYIAPATEEDRARPADGAWEFAYHLRPKHRSVTTIDGIKLVYYRPPSSTSAGKYQTAYAEPIPITVTDRPAMAVRPDLSVRTAPASFDELPDAAAALAPWGGEFAPPDWLYALLLLAPPLLTIAGVWSWRAWFGGRAATRQPRGRAARQALQALQEKDGEPVWLVFGRYLGERLDFPAAEPTPADLRRFLRRRGVARPVAEQLARFVATCDAARFAGAYAASGAALQEEARRLIHALEDDLCTP